MNRVACIYFEGNDSKVALFDRENKKLKMLKAESIDMSLAFAEQKSVIGGNGNNPKQKEVYNYNFAVDESSGFNKAYLQKLNEFFYSEDLSKCLFIPILTEPAIYFQKVERKGDLASLNVSSKGKIETIIDYVQLYNNSTLAVYPSGKSNYLQAIDLLAQLNNRKFLKIPSVKSAEISLASYVSRKYSFDPGKITLILYVGKEYSRLIFLNGNKISNIGSKIAVGKNSFNATNVIISKILLEMEHDSLNNLDNIIISGEDDSNEFLSAISEAYPDSKVRTIVLDDLEIQNIDSFTSLPGFTVPIAVAEEYYFELDKKVKGINLLPGYIKEEQKLFNVGWQGYLFLFLILLAAALFTFRISTNVQNSEKMDKEIKRLKLVQAQNREAVRKIKSYENKIQNIDQTKAILDRLSTGTGILSLQMEKLSGFTDARRTLWVSQLLMEPNNNLKIGGFTLSRPAIKTLSDSYKDALLKNITYEPMRDLRTFKYLIDTGPKPVGVSKGGAK